MLFRLYSQLQPYFFRHEDKDMKLKAAEAHLKLGEVGLETEQYETAIDDFKSCLKIQQDFLEAESRLIAETYPLQHRNSASHFKIMVLNYKLNYCELFYTQVCYG